MKSLSRVQDDLMLFEFAPGRRTTRGTLRRLLPDVPTALFFAKVYNLDYEYLQKLIQLLFNSTVVRELLSGVHSTELQSYIVDTVPSDVYSGGARPEFSPNVPAGEILPELWDMIELTVAKSIQEVADKLGNVLDRLPSKDAQVTFEHLKKFNTQRNSIGTFELMFKHHRQQKNLVILDVSGSMTEETIRNIVDDVVALSYKADAALAIVSNSTFYWEAGTFDTDDVLHAAEYGGTRYETLVPLFKEDWGTVITIADYDSSRSAADAIANQATGTIEKVVDISLVGRPTFLAACVGQLAQEVEPVLIASKSL